MQNQYTVDRFWPSAYSAEHMQAEVVSLTRAVVSVDSSPANLVPGENGTVDIWERFARGAGLQVERFTTVQGKPVLIVTLPGTRPGQGAIGFVHHSDVVSVEGHWQLGDPFGGAIARDELGREVLVGRGSVDTKGPASQILVAMKFLQQNGITIGRPVKLFLFPDEESGGADGAFWVAENRPDVLRDVEYWVVEGSGLLSKETLRHIPHQGPDRDIPFIAVAQKYSIPLRVELTEPMSEDEAIRRTLTALSRLDRYLEHRRWTHLGDKRESAEAYRRLGDFVGGFQGWILRHFWNQKLIQHRLPAEIAATAKTDASKTDFALSSNPHGQTGLDPNLKPSSVTVILDVALRGLDRQRALAEMARAAGRDFDIVPLPDLASPGHLPVRLTLPQDNYRGVSHGAVADRSKDAIDVTDQALKRVEKRFQKLGWANRLRRLDYFTSKSDHAVSGQSGEPVATRVTLDLRIQVDDDRERVIQEIRKALGPAFTVTPQAGRADFEAEVRRTSYRSPLFQTVQEVNGQFYGKDTAALFGTSPGSNDVRHLMRLNPHSQAISFTPVLITEHGPHAPDEAVTVQSLQQGTEWTVEFLKLLGNR